MLRSLFFAAIVLTIGISVVVGLDSFTLDDYINNTFKDTTWKGVWYNDTTILDRDGKDNFLLYNVETKTDSVFLSSTNLTNYPGASLTISPSKRFVLVKYSSTKVYRHSTLAKFAVLDKDKEYEAIDLPAEIKNEQLHICKFTSDNSLVAVKEDNNIYLIEQLDGKPKPTKITTDGSQSTFNGIPDWIYEEEVISGDSALWPSPHTGAFAYAKFNDKDVLNFTYFKYGAPGEFKDQYPTPMTVRYPKSGTENPTFSVHVYIDETSSNELKLTLEETSTATKDYVLYDLAWWSAEKVVVVYTNRAQNSAYMDECIIKTGKCSRLVSSNEPNGWLNVLPLYILSETHVVEVISQNNFDVFRVIKNAKDTKIIPLGNVTVARILGHTGSKIYFEGTEAMQHSQQHVFSVDVDTPNSKKCHSCTLRVNGELCLRASAVFSKNMAYVTRICSGPGPTYVDIKQFNNTSPPIKVLINNAVLTTKLKSKMMPTKMELFVDIPNTTKPPLTAAVRLLLPPGLSQESSEKYPMLVHVYAGPNSNQISDAYSIGIQHYMVTNKRYIYAYIDGSGSGKRGNQLMHRVYKALGTHEIDDQISVTKYLISKYNFIDATKVGIWGWSYGGFSTAHAIARDNGTFKCGVSVAPVSDFIYYDSIYTERYLGVYNDSDPVVKDIYKKTDVTKEASNFKNKNYLLVHGNADDNVHYQQGMQLARALEVADVPFEQMSYPDEAHDLAGVKLHLYHMLDAYWTKHLGVGPKAKSGAASHAHGRAYLRQKTVQQHYKHRKHCHDCD